MAARRGLDQRGRILFGYQRGGVPKFLAPRLRQQIRSQQPPRASYCSDAVFNSARKGLQKKHGGMKHGNTVGAPSGRNQRGASNC